MGRVLDATGLVLCAGLLGLGLWGRIDPPDYRGRFAEALLPYDEAIARLDAAHAAKGATAAFVAEAADIYDRATAYDWPPGLARVAVRDNWLLAAFALADPLLHQAGLKADGPLFAQFESFRYARALGRGFGICSQNALGFADLPPDRSIMRGLVRETSQILGVYGSVVEPGVVRPGDAVRAV